MVHDERDRAVLPLNSTVILDPLMAADLPGERDCSIVRGKRRDSNFPQKVNGNPLEVLTIVNILWTTDDSAI